MNIIWPYIGLWGSWEQSRSASAETDTAKGAKLPLLLRETPQSFTIVTRERLDDQNLESLQDVLDNTHYGEPLAVSASPNWQF